MATQFPFDISQGREPVPVPLVDGNRDQLEHLQNTLTVS
jgi:hypothetical protein